MTLATTLFSVNQVAEQLGVQARTVRRYLREGLLKGTRIGKQYRITKADLEAFAGPALTQPERAAVKRHRSIEVSGIVAITAIDRERASRMTNSLVAAANSRREDKEPPLRVETIYDEMRATLKVILIGGAESVAYLLRLVQLIAES